MDKKPQPKNDEFQRFEDLTRKLVSVPKKDIQEREKEKRSVRQKQKVG